MEHGAVSLHLFMNPETEAFGARARARAASERARVLYSVTLVPFDCFGLMNYI